MTEQTSFVDRTVTAEQLAALSAQGVGRVVARVLAGRGIESAQDLDMGLGLLLKPALLKGAAEAGQVLASAIMDGARVTIVADYDCDGATACATMIRGMEMLGAKVGTVNYLVPDRQKDGYGLTPVIVDRAIEQQRPDVLVTVDNGIASFEGVERAREMGLKTVITDHHLPAIQEGVVAVPNADVIVNPSQPGCSFQSKALCGAGVAFYTMLMTRSALRERGVFTVQSQPRLDCLLDLVALATVADVVPLDANNRRLVSQGLERIRAGKYQAGIGALLHVAGKNPEQVTSTDMGFTLGPRINAAGRLADMTIGIECLITNNEETAHELALELHKINQERRDVEGEMKEIADQAVAAMASVTDQLAIVVYDESFHEGVVGIVAGRIKEREHRPTFVFATAQDGNLKGSGRSIPGFHLRDALDLVAKRNPGLILKFGGHAMAAGCTITSDGVDAFRSALQEVARAWLSEEVLARTRLTDGELECEDVTVETARLLDGHVWGQAFEPPLFINDLKVVEQRTLKDKHLKLKLAMGRTRLEGIWFGRTEPLPPEARLAYQLSVNEWNGRESVQLMIQGMANEEHGAE